MATPMSSGIHPGKKPRRLRGTPSWRIRNYFATGVLVAGTALFALIQALTYNKEKNEKIRQFLAVTEEEKDRRGLMSLIKPRRGEEILRIMEEAEEIKKKI
ncbi:unnamed protein product [Hermetia illucens]|uniref:Cytochrome c oxidase assembly factor 3 n=1 Tax=Hermetia illucens TaxID=343691 RepID=A0A7R8V316_HERIL|nr:uncharacterized protein LOC119659680 [Hermetia illucens]CAD7091946.1 unnamed protein product [Hermetia illucens]